MENSGVVRHGPTWLPPGFRFHPTDEELVAHYLKRKALSFPLPASIIPEIDLRKHNPWNLPGAPDKERYFFSLRETKYPNGSRHNRETSFGYWKRTGKDRKIVASRSNQVVGMKSLLVFYLGKPPKGTRTAWMMHEYWLAGTETSACVRPQRKNSIHSSMVPMGDWVLCRIFLKRRATRMDKETSEYHNDAPARHDAIRFIDFMGQNNNHQQSSPSSSSSSDSSCVTELLDPSGNREESDGSIDSSPCGGEP